MFTYPLNISRPVRQYNGSDYSEQMAPSGYSVIWANPVVMSQAVTLQVHADEDVRIGDIIRIPYNITLRGEAL